MNFIIWLVIGGIIGWLASMVMHTRSGILMDIIVGIIGAAIGGFLFNVLGAPGATGFNLWSLLVAFIGAVVLLGLLRLVTGRPPTAY